MSYKAIVKERGYASLSQAYADGRIKYGDEFFAGFIIPKRYQVFAEKDGSLIGIEDPVMAWSTNVKELIGNKRWKVKVKN